MTDVPRRYWGLNGEMIRLDGEFDSNYRVNADHGISVLKVMRRECDPEFVRMQIGAIDFLRNSDSAIPVPDIVPARNGKRIVEFIDRDRCRRLAWMQKWISGTRLADFRPCGMPLFHALGRMAGRIAKGLEPYTHSMLRREFKWNPLQAMWVRDEIRCIEDSGRRALLRSILEQYCVVQEDLGALPVQAIHNDLNDCNVLVAGEPDREPEITGVLDFGDMCQAPRICELAVASAYAVFREAEPERVLSAIAAGFHSEAPLSETEIDLLWPLLRMRLAVSVVNSALMALKRPDDPYVTISEAPAWDFLMTGRVDPDLLRARLRVACGLPATREGTGVCSWLDSRRGGFAPVLGCDLSEASVVPLSVGECPVPANPFLLTDTEAAGLGGAVGGELRLGRYGEPRLIYTSSAFMSGDRNTAARRTVHLGVDVFAPAGTPVSAPYDGRVQWVEDRSGRLDYGGLVILRHECEAGSFFTLYGHLDAECLDRLTPGTDISTGAVFARLGDVAQSGGWAPHLHLQLALTLDGVGTDWPGVADPDDLELWTGICPNPAALLNLADERIGFSAVDRDGIRADRSRRFGANVSLSYRDPVMFLRGWRHYLFDEYGRTFLDAYNNVPHAGHAHPRIRAVASVQLGLLNTNTRYLHPDQVAFAEALLSRFPDRFSKCYFVNSGTEGNELAMRLARSYTGGIDMIVMDHGYHGNSTGSVALSAYKFNAPGGPGQLHWVHLVELPDDYRGPFRRGDPERGLKFADQVDVAVQAIARRGGKLAGFIAETFPSVGGQIVPPPGYLASVYGKIRAAGGVCIADEVQTGLGRLGEYYFGFEQQQAVPDIVVLGKPLGNGFPIGAVVTTAGIADSFARGPEFFSTFGGSTLSCRIGKTLLDIIEEERLQENAAKMGHRLCEGLRGLQSCHGAIGDVRGMGLFVGVDLVADRERRTPASAVAQYVQERMRERRILLGCEGPALNVLKVRPPLTIEADDIDLILEALDQVLSETAVACSVSAGRCEHSH